MQLAFGYCLKCPFSFTVEPMRDTEVVASIRARSPEGLAEAYDRYAARIFSFCRGLLGDPADATGAVRDTFVIAVSAMDELHILLLLPDLNQKLPFTIKPRLPTAYIT